MKTGSSLRKRIIIFSVVLAIMVFGIGFFITVQGDGVKAVPVDEKIIRPVKIMTISESVQYETRTFPGVIQAAREVKLAFRVGGPLVALDLDIGQHVNKGDVIARIDARDFEINRLRLSAALDEARAGLEAMQKGARSEDIASLEAQLSAARVRLDDAERNFERQRNLLADHVIAQVEYDNAAAALDTAKANVDVAQQELNKARTGARKEDIQAAEAGIKRLQADLQAAENALRDTWLKAPFSGYVDKQHVENFENVAPGQPIVTLLDFSSVEVRTAVPETIVIRQQDIVDVTSTLDAYGNKAFAATIKEVGRKTESANQSYPLTATLSGHQDLSPQPGMAATLTLKLKKNDSRGQGMLIPATAVFADPKGLPCVWKVDMSTHRVMRIPVDTGKPLQDAIEITSGLNDGDRIVTAGARFLQPDQEVRILNSVKGGAQ